jgi:hypothetical protein
MKSMESSDTAQPKGTLAAGEINITAICNGKFYFRIKKLKIID